MKRTCTTPKRRKIARPRPPLAHPRRLAPDHCPCGQAAEAFAHDPDPLTASLALIGKWGGPAAALEHVYRELEASPGALNCAAVRATLRLLQSAALDERRGIDWRDELATFLTPAGLVA